MKYLSTLMSRKVNMVSEKKLGIVGTLHSSLFCQYSIPWYWWVKLKGNDLKSSKKVKKNGFSLHYMAWIAFFKMGMSLWCFKASFLKNNKWYRKLPWPISVLKGIEICVAVPEAIFQETWENINKVSSGQSLKVYRMNTGYWLTLQLITFGRKSSNINFCCYHIYIFISSIFCLVFKHLLANS